MTLALTNPVVFIIVVFAVFTLAAAIADTWGWLADRRDARRARDFQRELIRRQTWVRIRMIDCDHTHGLFQDRSPRMAAGRAGAEPHAGDGPASLPGLPGASAPAT